MAVWSHAESVQITPAELSNENLMRIWDALSPSYRLSTSYVARAVRVDAQPQAESRPVVSTRFGFEKKMLEPVDD